MKQHFMPPDTLKPEHMKEFGLKTYDYDGKIIRNEIKEDDMQIVVFDTGFVLFKIIGKDAIFGSYYRSKDSTIPVEPMWKDLLETLRINGCTRVICYAINDKIRDIYESKYGFTTTGYDDVRSRYDMEMEL